MEEYIVNEGVILEDYLWYELSLLKNQVEHALVKIKKIEQVVKQHKENKSIIAPHIANKVWAKNLMLDDKIAGEIKEINNG